MSYGGMGIISTVEKMYDLLSVNARFIYLLHIPVYSRLHNKFSVEKGDK